MRDLLAVVAVTVDAGVVDRIGVRCAVNVDVQVGVAESLVGRERLPFVVETREVLEAAVEDGPRRRSGPSPLSRGRSGSAGTSACP
jgi:hypothetical protein